MFKFSQNNRYKAEIGYDADGMTAPQNKQTKIANSDDILFVDANVKRVNIAATAHTAIKKFDKPSKKKWKTVEQPLPDKDVLYIPLSAQQPSNWRSRHLSTQTSEDVALLHMKGPKKAKPAKVKHSRKITARLLMQSLEPQPLELPQIFEEKFRTVPLIYSGAVISPRRPSVLMSQCSEEHEILSSNKHTVLELWHYVRDHKLAVEIVVPQLELDNLAKYTQYFSLVRVRDFIYVYTKCTLLGILVQASSKRFAIIHSRGYVSLKFKARGLDMPQIFHACAMGEILPLGRCYSSLLDYGIDRSPDDSNSVKDAARRAYKKSQKSRLRNKRTHFRNECSIQYGCSTRKRTLGKRRRIRRLAKYLVMFEPPDLAPVKEKFQSEALVDMAMGLRNAFMGLSTAAHVASEAYRIGNNAYDYMRKPVPVTPPSSFIDGALSKIESMVFLLGSLYKSNGSVLACACAIGQWIKAMGFQPSLALKLSELLKFQFRVDVTATPLATSEPRVENEDVFNNEAWTFEDIGSKIKAIFTDWKSVKDSKFVVSLMDIYTEMVVNGWLPELVGSSERYSLTGFAMEMVSRKVAEKRKQSSSLVECIFESVIYVVEHAYTAVAHGNLSYLFLENAELMALENEYMDIVAAQSMIENEDVARSGATIPFQDMDDYHARVSLLLMKYEEFKILDARNADRKTIMQSPYSIRITMLKKIRNQLIEHFRNSCIREKPFAVMLYGGTGLGKSTLTQLIASHLGPTLGVKYDKDGLQNKICFINEGDKHDNAYRQGHEIVIIDDMANRKIEFYTESPAERFLRVVNTASTEVVKADLGSKGNVFYRPKLVIVTTNEKSLMSDKFSNEPASIMRRFDAVLTCSVKEGFNTPDGSLDSAAYAAHSDAGETIPDAWDIIYERVVVHRVVDKPGVRDQVTFAKVFTKPVNIMQTLVYLRKMCEQHNEKQKSMVSDVKKLFTHEVWCDCPYEKRFLRKQCPICSKVGIARPILDPPIVKKVCPPVEELPLAKPPEKAKYRKVRKFALDPSTMEEVSYFSNELMTLVQEGFEESVSPSHFMSAIPEAEESEDDDAVTWYDSIAPEPPVTTLYNPNPVFPDTISEPSTWHSKDYVPEPKTEVVADYVKFGNWQAKVVENHNFACAGLPPVNLAIGTSNHDDEMTISSDIPQTIGCTVPNDYDMDGKSLSHLLESFAIPRNNDQHNTLFISEDEAYRCGVEAGWVDAISVAPEGGILEWVHQKTWEFLCSKASGDMAIAVAAAVGTCALWSAFIAVKNFVVSAFTYAPEFFSESAEPVVITPLAGDVKVLRKIPITPPEKTQAATTTTPDALRTLMKKHLLKVKLVQNSSVLGKVIKRGSAIPLSGAYILVPDHLLFDGAFTCNVMSATDTHWHTSAVHKKTHCVSVGKLYKDLTIMFVPSLGSRASFLPYFPTRASKQVTYQNGTMVAWRCEQATDEYTIIENLVNEFSMRKHIKVEGGAVKTDFTGHTYVTGVRTVQGDCASPIIDNQHAVIIGLHLGGEVNQHLNKGACGSPYYEDLMEAIQKMATKDPSSDIASQGAYQFTRFGKTDEMLTEIPENHCLNKLDPTGEYTMNVLGHHKAGRAKFRSSIERYPNAHLVEEHFNLLSVHFTPSEARAGNKAVAAKEWEKDLRKISNCDCHFEPLTWAAARKDYLEQVRGVCELPSNAEYIAQMGKINNEDNLNGVDSVNYMYSIDFSTSAGWPLNRPKKEMLDPSAPTEKREFQRVVWDEVDHIESLLKDGKRCYAPFRACLKDEALKVTKPKLRVFSGSNVAFTLLTRRYFLTMIRFICQNWLGFECAVGINSFGADWDQLAKFILEKATEGDGERVLAGDYSSFDKKMPVEATLAAFDVLLFLARFSGKYDEEDIRVMKGIMTEICYPLYEYDSMFIQIFGTNPSGHPLTVIINSIVNSLYQRYAFKAFYANYRFKDHVSLATFGDDNVGGVGSKVPLYNMSNITAVLAASGITYTLSDAEKGSGVDLTYQTLDEVSFLKRDFRYDEELNRWVGPLSRASILKSMTFYHDKKSTLVGYVAEQFALAIVGSLREWALYGRREFDERREQSRRLLIATKNDKYINLWKYDEYVEAFDRYPPRILGGNWIAWLEDTEKEPFKPPLTLQLEGVETGSDGNDLRPGDIVVSKNECFAMVIRPQTREGVGCPALVRYLKRPTKTTRIMPFTGESEHSVDSTDSSPVFQCQSLVTFSDLANVTDTRTEAVDQVSGVLATPEFDLNDFLRRPIKIAELVIPATNTPAATSIEPWWYFLRNKRISNRINNYAYFRGNLHLKFVINGTPFHFGRVLVSYEPLSSSRTFNIASIVPDAGDYMRLSQMQHLYLNPTTCQGGEMILPYIWPQDATPINAADVGALGTLYIGTIAEIAALSISASPVYIAVYAWMENAEFITPTMENTDMLTPQGDEYSTSVVSDTATSISRAAGALDKVPIIGKYALATQMAASAVATVARAAGFSKPCILEQPTVVRPVGAGNTCNYNGPDPSVRLTMDAKQELTVDPTTVGLPAGDDMDISRLCARESYFRTFEWSVNDPTDRSKYTLAVTPKLFSKYTSTDYGMRIDTVPMAWIAPNFKFWRGTIKFRFQVVKSMYHSGRLRIVFDPLGYSVDLTTERKDNLVHSWIIDLSENDDMVVECGWTQPTTYLRVNRNPAIPFDTQDNPSDYSNLLLSNGVANGILSVSVVTPLMVPDSTLSNTSVKVLISASSDDMEFAVPVPDALNYCTYLPRREVALLNAEPEEPEEFESQGSVELASDALVQPSAGPPHVSLYDTPSPPKINQLYFGERVTNLRQVIKRYVKHGAYILDPAIISTVVSYRLEQPNFPMQQGYYAGFPFVDNSSGRVNYAKLGPITYFAPGFAGWRGSVRWKFLKDAYRLNLSFPSVLSVTNSDSLVFDTLTTAIPAYTYQSGHSYWNYAYDNIGFAGMAIGQECVNSTMEVEVPFQSNFKMASPRDLCLGSSTPGSISPVGFRFANRSHAYRSKEYSNNKGITATFVAGGEDFSLMGFICTPPLFRQNYLPNTG